MPSPFPGMNPYLESPDRWSTVHNRLIVAMADLLTPPLLPKYQVDIDKRVCEVMGINMVLSGRPSITIQQSRHPHQLPESVSFESGITTAKAPVSVMLPMPEEVREPYLEVKDAETQAVVTAIEILSPSNKRGNGRQRYLEKRQKILQSRTHLIEVDLLTQPDPLPLAQGTITSHYHILVSRSQSRPAAGLYPFNLPEPIPTVPLPLAPNDPELMIDLQNLLHQVYDRSGYDYFIGYQQDVELSFTDVYLVWIGKLLKEKGLQ